MIQWRRMAAIAAIILLTAFAGACGSSEDEGANNTAYGGEIPVVTDSGEDALNTAADMGIADNALGSSANMVDASGGEAEPVRRKKRP